MKKMIELFKNTFWYILLRMLKYIRRTQEMWNIAVAYNPYTLRFILDHLKSQEMYNEVMRDNPAVFCLTRDYFKTQKMYHGC